MSQVTDETPEAVLEAEDVVRDLFVRIAEEATNLLPAGVTPKDIRKRERFHYLAVAADRVIGLEPAK